MIEIGIPPNLLLLGGDFVLSWHGFFAAVAILMAVFLVGRWAPLFELDSDDENILIDISDNGPGIPQEKYEDVFKPFYTLDPSRNNLKGESGLGMTIARDIIRSHGGDIKLSRSNSLS